MKCFLEFISFSYRRLKMNITYDMIYLTNYIFSIKSKIFAIIILSTFFVYDCVRELLCISIGRIKYGWSHGGNAIAAFTE